MRAILRTRTIHTNDIIHATTASMMLSSPCSVTAVSCLSVCRSLHTSFPSFHNRPFWPVRSAEHFRELKRQQVEAKVKERLSNQQRIPYIVVKHEHPVAPTQELLSGAQVPEAELVAGGEGDQAKMKQLSTLLTPPAHFAIFRYRGGQFKVVEDDLVMLDRVADANIGDFITVNEVLLLAGRDSTLIGRPLVHGAQVVLQVEEHTQTRKVIVFKKKRRKGYKKKMGHRDMVTMARVIKVLLPKGVEPLTKGSKVEYAEEIAEEESDADAANTAVPTTGTSSAASSTVGPSPSSPKTAGSARAFSTFTRSLFTSALPAPRTSILVNSTNTVPFSTAPIQTPSSASSDPATTPRLHTNEDTIRQLLTKELKASTLHIEDTSGGCGAFFRVLVVSPAFDGLSMVKQHRLVNATLKSHIANLHGLTLQTFTEEQWKKEQEKAAARYNAQ